MIAEVNGEERDLASPLPDGDAVAIVTDDDRPGPAHASATRRPTCWPRPCSTCSRGPRSASARRSRTASTTTSSCPTAATFTPDDLDRIDARMREIIAETPALRPRRDPRRRGPRALRRPPVQAGDHRRRRPTTRCRPRASGLVRTYENPPDFIDLCRGPARPRHGPPRPLQADAGRRRLLAGRRAATRCCSASTARRGTSKTGPRRPPPPPRGGRASATTASSAPSSTCSRFPDEIGRRPRRLPPEGRHRAPADGGLQPPAPRGRRLRVRLLAAHHQGRRCSRPAGTSTGTPTACTRPWSWTSGTEYYLKPMNCPFHILIFRQPAAVATASCRCGCSSSARCTATRSRASSTASRASGASPRTTPTSSAPRSRWPTSWSPPRLRVSVLRDFGLDDFYLELSTKPEGKAVGTDEEWDEATEALRRALEAQGPRARASTRAAARSTARRSTVQVRDAIGRTWQLSTIQVDFQLPAALRPRVRRRRQRAPPADHDPPRPVRLDRAVLRRAASSTTPAPSRPGWRRCRSGCCRSATTTSAYAGQAGRPAAGRGLPGRHGRRRRAARRPHPQGQAGEAARTSWWSATTTSRTAPSASTPAAARSSGTSASTTSSTAWPPTSSAT